MPDLTPLPPIADQPISVILLARNEQPHLEAVVADWSALLDGLKTDYEILLVDDGSTDGTGALAEALVARWPRLRVLRHPQPRGVGAALRTALAAATRPLLFYTTADRQYQPADLKRLLVEIDKVHLISGYRVWQPVPGVWRWLGAAWRLFWRVVLGVSAEPLPGWLGWREHLYRLFCRVVFALRLQDMNCTFRLFRRDIFARIPIQSNGDFVHTEILAKANFLGCYMNDEVPLTYRPREGATRDGMWRDGYRVFSRPDFGPAVLPAAVEERMKAELPG